MGSVVQLLNLDASNFLKTMNLVFKDRPDGLPALGAKADSALEFDITQAGTEAVIAPLKDSRWKCSWVPFQAASSDEAPLTSEFAITGPLTGCTIGVYEGKAGPLFFHLAPDAGGPNIPQVTTLRSNPRNFIFSPLEYNRFREEGADPRLMVIGVKDKASWLFWAQVQVYKGGPYVRKGPPVMVGRFPNT